MQVNEPGHSQFIQEAHQQPAASSDMPSQPLQSVQLSYVGYKPGSQAPQVHWMCALAHGMAGGRLKFAVVQLLIHP